MLAIRLRLASADRSTGSFASTSDVPRPSTTKSGISGRRRFSSQRDRRKHGHALVRLRIDKRHIGRLRVFGDHLVEPDRIGNHHPIEPDPALVEPPGILRGKDDRRDVREPAAIVVAEVVQVKDNRDAAGLAPGASAPGSPDGRRR